jgi:hypothetical protein
MSDQFQPHPDCPGCKRVLHPIRFTECEAGIIMRCMAHFYDSEESIAAKVQNAAYIMAVKESHGLAIIEKINASIDE